MEPQLFLLSGSVSQWIVAIQIELEKARVECGDFRAHAERVLEAASGWDRQYAFRESETLVDENVAVKIRETLTRRLSGEPVQYLAGEEGFWNSQFKVGPGVLIPRRETELLVEFLLRSAGRQTGLRIAELGAGSGNIGISVLQERADWSWFAYELNPNSIPYLEVNARNLLPGTSNYSYKLGDFFELAPRRAPFDWIVANPPYIRADEIATLSAEVRREPTLALDGGESGLDFYRRIAAAAPKLLTSGGGLILEFGSEQGADVLEIFSIPAFSNVQLHQDYAGLLRVLSATYNAT